MKIILTNDDGIDAPGIRALHEAVEGLGERIVVAPKTPQSGVGHKVTTVEPIAVAEEERGFFAVGGTPADCARIALTHIAPDADWVLSGINHGGNLGADFYPSGTIAAAREAVLLGCPSIAISQYVARDRDISWAAAARRAAQVIRRLVADPPGRGEYYNVNLPHPADDDADCEVVFCRIDHSPWDVRFRREEEGYVYEGYYHRRPRLPEHDIDVCFSGRIAVTRCSLDLNRQPGT